MWSPWLCPHPVAPGTQPRACGHQAGLTAVVLGTALVGLGGRRHRYQAGRGAGWGQGAGLRPAAQGPCAVLTGAPLASHADSVAGLQDERV